MEKVFTVGSLVVWKRCCLRWVILCGKGVVYSGYSCCVEKVLFTVGSLVVWKRCCCLQWVVLLCGKGVQSGQFCCMEKVFLFSQSR